MDGNIELIISLAWIAVLACCFMFGLFWMLLKSDAEVARLRIENARLRDQINSLERMGLKRYHNMPTDDIRPDPISGWKPT